MKRSALLVAFCLLSRCLPGQTFSANLTGLVTDPAGALVPAAEMLLVDADTGDIRRTVTNAEGRYTFSQIAPANYVIEVGYAGNQGRKLIENGAFQANQLPDNYLSLGNALFQSVPNPFFGTGIATGTLSGATVQRGQLLRPYPQYAGVGLLITPGASSSFNALNAKITHRFGHGLMMSASYQFSKAIDNVSEDGTGTIRDYNNLSLDRSLSAHDFPHSFVTNYRYELPFGKGRAYAASSPRGVDAIIGGWSVAGIYSYTSGLPLAFTTSNNTNSFGGSQLPNIANGPALAILNQSRFAWFNVADVSQPAAFTYGNAPRYEGYVRAQASNQLDMGVTKTFALPWESVKLNFRADAYNAFNHNVFAAPIANYSLTTFGQVTSSRSTPPKYPVGSAPEFLDRSTSRVETGAGLAPTFAAEQTITDGKER